MTIYTIQRRAKHLINTDPQRRCYNGCHYKSEIVWGAWEVLESDIPEDRIETRLTFWRELNDYAVSERGDSARAEFRRIKNDRYTGKGVSLTVGGKKVDIIKS